MKANEEITFLRKRITDLEKQLDNLRLSRRVLMDLLEQIEKEKNNLSAQLQKTKRPRKQRGTGFKKEYSQNFELYNLQNYLKD